MYEEMFGGELEMTEETNKSQVRQYWDWLHERNDKQLEILRKVESPLEKMDLQGQEEYAPPYQGRHTGGEEGARGAAV